MSLTWMKQLEARLEKELADVRAAIAAASKKVVRLHAILDASISMQSIESATIEGFNAFIATQREDTSTETTVSLSTFSGPGTARSVYRDIPLSQVPTLTNAEYRATGGSTALNDAVHAELYVHGKFSVPETDAHVVLIITDGQENSSRSHTKEQVRALIAQLEARGNWTFVYIGADSSTWAEAKSYGVAAGSTYHFTHDMAGVKESFVNLSTATSSFRGEVANGALRSVSYFNPADISPAEANAVVGTTTVKLDDADAK